MKYIRLSLMNNHKRQEIDPRYFILEAFYWPIEGEAEYWNQLNDKWEQLISKKIEDSTFSRRNDICY